MGADEAVSPERLKELLRGINPEVLQQVMPLTGGVLTMMFTDIVNSTGIKAKVGDKTFFAALKRHHELVRESVSARNGREIRTMGDAFFIGFSVPAEAVICAVEIQQRLAKTPILAGGECLQIRIGLHRAAPSSSATRLQAH